MKNLLRAALIGALLVPGSHVAAQSKHALPFLTPASNLSQLGLVRIINHSDHAGTVRIHATDDTGERFGPVELGLGANQAKHINSHDLEHGNASKDLSGGVGDGEGNWHLELETELEIDALGYLRTPDGFLTEMHSVVPRGENGRYHVLFFNPASNQNLVSRLRIVNPHPERVAFTITAVDDSGMPGREPMRFAISANAARAFSSSQLEARFGDGKGKWQFFVSATKPVWVMNLITNRSGFITNVSLPAPELVAIEPQTPRSLAWDGKFSETTANNGSVSGRVTATLTGDTFTDDVVSAGHVTATNVPAGLTARFERTSSTKVMLMLDGRARRHANANDVSNLSVAFANGAFERGDAASVSRYSNRSLRVDFRDPTVVEDLAPANAAALYSLAKGKKIVVSVNHIPVEEYRLTSTSRFTARDLASGFGLGGRWTYTKGPRHQGNVRFTFDRVQGVDVGSCSVEIMFSTRTSGRFSAYCTGFLLGGDGMFQIKSLF